LIYRTRRKEKTRGGETGRGEARRNWKQRPGLTLCAEKGNLGKLDSKKETLERILSKWKKRTEGHEVGEEGGAIRLR